MVVVAIGSFRNRERSDAFLISQQQSQTSPGVISNTGTESFHERRAVNFPNGGENQVLYFITDYNPTLDKRVPQEVLYQNLVEDTSSRLVSNRKK